MTSSGADPLRTAISTIEASYEFMLAYAAQGRDDESRDTSPSIRTVLTELSQAIGALEAHLRAALTTLGAHGAKLTPFADILGQDAKRAKALVDVALSVPSMSSLLVDNLNATVHVRTLLTSMFLMDEAMDALQRGG